MNLDALHKQINMNVARKHRPRPSVVDITDITDSYSGNFVIFSEKKNDDNTYNNYQLTKSDIDDQLDSYIKKALDTNKSNNNKNYIFSL